MNICYFYLFFSLFVSFRLKVCGLLPLPSSERVGENVAYRMLSFTLTHIPIAAIAANRLIIIVMFIFLKPFLSFFSILKSSTQSSFYTIFQLKPQFIILCSSLPLFIIETNCYCFSTDLYSEILFHLSVSKPSFNLIALKTLMPYFLKPNLYYYS